MKRQAERGSEARNTTVLGGQTAGPVGAGWVEAGTVIAAGVVVVADVAAVVSAPQAAATKMVPFMPNVQCGLKWCHGSAAILTLPTGDLHAAANPNNMPTGDFTRCSQSEQHA